MTVEITPARHLKNSFDQAVLDRALMAGLRCKGSFKQAISAIRRIIILQNLQRHNFRSTRYRIIRKSKGDMETASIIAVRPSEKIVILTIQS